MAEGPVLAYLSQGKLHLVRGGEVTRIESAFADDVQRREEEIHRRNAWKTEGSGARFTGGLFLSAQQLAPSIPARVASVSPGRAPGELLYAIQVGTLGGLFTYDLTNARETRIQHGREERLLHLSRPGPDATVACSVESKSGARHLALLNLGGDGYDLQEVTEGDSRDEAPSWVEGKRSLVYQSSGLARSPEGHLLGASPYSIQRVDLETGVIEELASHDKLDFLGPRQTADGTLLFIQRPHGPRRMGPFKWLLAILTLPFRFLYAIFQWLNFFTIRYTGKPLSTDGREQENADARQMLIWGNLIDAAQAERDARSRGDDALSLVGSDWKLVRRAPNGVESVVADSVLSFDVSPDGSVVYTNGSAIYRLPEDGTRERIAEGRFIEQVVALG